MSYAIEYFLPAAGTVVTESYVLAAAPPSITLTSSVSVLGSEEVLRRAAARGFAPQSPLALSAAGPALLNRFGATFPAMLWDGATNATVLVDAARNLSTVSAAAWGDVAQSFAVQPVAGRDLVWSWNASASIVSRNGLVAPIAAEIVPCCGTADPAITLVLAPVRI